MSRTVGGVEPTPSMILYTRPTVAAKPTVLPGLTVVWVVMMLGGLLMLGRPTPTARPKPKPLESQVADLADRVRSLESEVQALTPPRSLIRIAGD